MMPIRNTAWRLTPLALSMAMAAVGAALPHGAQAAGAWFAASGAGKTTAVQNQGLGRAGGPLPGTGAAAAQQAAAKQKLARSIDNLNRTAGAIAAQQAAQAAARSAAQQAASDIPDGLAEGGLKIDTQAATAGWLNAAAPVQTASAGKTTVTVRQTADRAILNWETFNVGRNTTVDFAQQADWSVLNRVNDPKARPSQIQGAIKGGGTVLLVNRNGIVFTGTSQVDVRNLVAAATDFTDAQFQANGIYGANGTGQSFTNAGGNVRVEAGAQLSTLAPTSVTQGGGYVLLLGKEVRNAGRIATPRGQAQLAAGDSFVIRKGYATDGNTWSTTRGNEVSPQMNGRTDVGLVENTGLLMAAEGDITLAGHDVRQNGVAVATTTVNQRGTVHLLNSATDATGSVVLGAAATTAVVLQDDGATALDSQRAALVVDSATQDGLRVYTGLFDNLSVLSDRRDQSRVEIVSGNTVDVAGGSLTLATGGQIAVSAAKRAQVESGATLDVSGAVGVQLAMSTNNVQVNVQGNEQRDAPVNRDSGTLNNSDVWVDIRRLLYVPAGTGGYAGDRYYTSGGLLEVSGYLGTQGHTIGQWAATGGTVALSGAEVVTRPGAMVNLAGGSYDVQSGYRNVTWLRGGDGRLYTVDDAPADLAFAGVYQGYEDKHARWGDESSRFFRSPLIAPERVYETGYTVGRDAGRLIVNAPTAILEGALDTSVYDGPRQGDTADAAQRDSYLRSQLAVARPGGLAIGRYNAQGLQGGYATDVRIGDIAPLRDAPGVDDALPEDRLNTAWLDAATLNAAGLGSLTITTTDRIRVESPLQLATGGSLKLSSTTIDVASAITARSGSIVLATFYDSPSGKTLMAGSSGASPSIVLQPGAALDTHGLWVNTLIDPAGTAGLAYLDGGDVTLDSSGAVTLSAGSLIDVTSGGAVLQKGKTRGGKGGDVTLIAGDPFGGGGAAPTTPENALHGLMTLDGAIRAYGVNGGGTLTVNSTGNLLIGDIAELAGGKLAAGTAAPVALKLAEALTIPAGEPLPMAYSVTFSTLALDTPSPAAVSLAVPTVRTSAAWVLPAGLGAVTYDPLGFYNGGDVLPANSKVLGWNGTLPAGGVVPSSVFPGGISINPYTTTLAAGAVSPTPVVYAAGTDIARGQVLPQTVAITPAPSLDQDFFTAGFARYDLNGGQGVIVARGAQIAPVMPVYQFTAGARSAPLGSDVSAGLSAWLPSLYTEHPDTATLTQRGGASLILHTITRSGSNVINGGGAMIVGEGAALTVDPGQSITLDSFGPLTLDGSLVAHGGAIDLTGAAIGDSAQTRNFDKAGNNLGNALWIGGSAVLDASGQAYGALDRYGRAYGVAGNGGTITLDGATSFVIVRPGAQLNADGAAQTVDMAAGQDRGVAQAPLTLAGNGGSIVFSSGSGLYLNGDFHAHGEGPGAAGGSLSVTLRTLSYKVEPSYTIPDSVLVPSTMMVTQAAAADVLPADQAPGQATGLSFGYGALGADQVRAGGFDALTLYSGDYMQFQGDVSLDLARSVSLSAASFTSGPPASFTVPEPLGTAPAVIDPSTPTATGNVRIAAPYVHLTGVNTAIPDGSVSGSAGNPMRLIPLPTQATFEADAGLLDIDGMIAFSSTLRKYDSATFRFVHRPSPGFKTVRLVSQGDLRFTPTDAPNGTTVRTPWDIELLAAQIYPTTGTRAAVYAGYYNRDYDATLTVGRTTGTVPDAPLSVLGNLTLAAPIIEQGGIVRAPFGAIYLGVTDENPITQRIDLLPGSLTSVSLAGVTVPYGGTVDGVTYTYNGTAVPTRSLTNMDSNAVTIQLASRAVDVQDGATLDLSGGGTLSGAGFVSGRGGSVNVLTTPLVNANPAHAGSQADNKVYALLPGYASAYAPVSPEKGAGDPAIGQQITLTSAVGDLPAGTYTLLPSNYALLPGAYRVELGRTLPAALPRTVALADGSYAASGYVGIAGTQVRASLPAQLLITPGSVVRTYSQYNEQSYSAFQIARAQQFGGVRPLLPEDGKSLMLWFNAPAEAGTAALAFDGTALLQAAQGGYAGQVATRNVGELYLDAPTAGYTGVSVSADALSAIAAPRLLVNGLLQVIDGRIRVTQAGSNDLVVRDGVTLTAGEIMLVGGNITLGRDAMLSTVGQGAGFFDTASTGLAYEAWATALALSNGQADFITSSNGGAGTITVSEGASLYGENTLAFATKGQVSLDDGAHFGARRINLAVNSLNIGSTEAIAAAGSPAGTVFDQRLFDLLLHGDPLHGAPALERLILTTGNAINLFGTTQLDARGTGVNLVLNASALYGYGSDGDQAMLAADRLQWNGVAGVNPPAITAGGAGTGSGTLTLRADEIALGQFLSLDNSVISRTAYGFANVDLDAGQRIVAAGSGALYVYQAPSTAAGAVFGKSGKGGNLTLRTPLLTGIQKSIAAYTAGGALRVVAPDGVAPSTAASTVAGAEIDLSGDSVAIGSAILLPSGKLVVNAQHDIALQDGSRIDLRGVPSMIQSATVYGFGGDAIFTSAQGGVAQAAGGTIDVSATHADAGTISVSAADGAVALAGVLNGAADDGYTSGAFDVKAATLADFGGLNARLTQGGVLQARSFALTTGDLILGDGVKAHTVEVSVDEGSLTVAGLIDASGAAPGTIRLSAKNGLTLAANAMLDAHGTALQTDSYGAAIEALNRGHIELAATGGTLTLSRGATLDLSTPDGVAYGDVQLFAPRTGETSGDLAIDAAGPFTLRGAHGVALNAMWTYDLPGGSVITQGTLNGYDAQSQAFIAAAYGGNASAGALSTTLRGKLAGLLAQGEAFHLRPGVQITSSGDLSTSGDIDLAGYRYGPHADRDTASAFYGAGEPMYLSIRTAGNLDVKGSLSDGFQAVPGIPGVYADIDVPGSGLFQRYSNSGYTYWQDSGTEVTLGADWLIPTTGFYAWWINTWWGPLFDTSGNQYYPGSLVRAGTTLNPRTSGNYGTIAFDASDLPRLQVAVSPAVPGSAATSPKAAMLAAGSLSASLRLVAGADLGSADSRAVQSAAALNGGGNLRLNDPAYTSAGNGSSFSVLRTGAGSLDLLAGGSFSEATPYGVYTAGTQSAAVLAADGSNPYDLMGASGAGHAWYPEQGGDLLLKAGLDVRGFIQTSDNSRRFVDSDLTSNWLWRQGASAVSDDLGAWWINFGASANTNPAVHAPLLNALIGFQGIGTLGGGNVSVIAGRNAGTMDGTGSAVSSGLDLAAASTGRVLADGSLLQTGGGNIVVKVGGALNRMTPVNPSTYTSDYYGAITALRGDVVIDAGSVGAIAQNPFAANWTSYDPRTLDVATLKRALLAQGPAVLPGDGSVVVTARGDLVFGGAGDPGMTASADRDQWWYTPAGAAMPVRGALTQFTLWQPDTGIALYSAGGDVTPQSGLSASLQNAGNFFPGTLTVVAANGDIRFGEPTSAASATASLELIPSAQGQLDLLAAGSIYGSAHVVAMSGADPASLATPLRPVTTIGNRSNATQDAAYMADDGRLNPLAFGEDTPTGKLHADDARPARVYAGVDIDDLVIGEAQTLIANVGQGFFPTHTTWYVAAKPFEVIAGRDIVGTGSTPSVFANNGANDITVFQAGRDILYQSIVIAGPGLLDVRAGRNMNQGYYGSLDSVGPLYGVNSASRSGGAGIAVSVGAGAQGPDYADFARLYFDAANQADLTAGHTLAEQPGKVAHAYAGELGEWLSQRYGYAGSPDEALAYFLALPAAQQGIFVRQVYYAELTAGGREYNDEAGPRYGSYLRGRQAIAALFPATDGAGNARSYTGDLTMFSGMGKLPSGTTALLDSGIHTEFGGGIQILNPGGRTLIGVEGITPGSGAGLITQGSGNIDIYSLGSILLGQSRIMTTFGGGILAWSAQGDINAGRGAKTTVVYTPPRRVYDNVGNVTLSPQAPATGAGIATLNPIPEVPPGDVDLIAPLGTIDAGEAGIRVSGNVNIAALQVVNAANIQVQGDSKGIPVTAVVNTGALTNASSAATSAATAAQDAVSRSRAAAQKALPSIISVQVLGFGMSDGGGTPAAPAGGPGASSSGAAGYRAAGMVQVLGHGSDPAQAASLTPGERRSMGF
ncbi:Heme:hemopexin utilization protein A [Bordetella ansorpii]|uniref:Heme:hemopexin utilization protein A n=1 Tax=Bordetella ansorpii TaxID=288768 RepID=A0A157SDU6_9BORD|nr:filamentous haemagglutinin family protein [Bordetella ansorpii]SAI68431.1 Heme:hemopexin utilization protein A [Bordetella ansorpii]